MTYQIYNSNGSTASNNSLIYFNQASGNLYVISNSVFSLSLYIKVTSTHSPSYSTVQSITFQISQQCGNDIVIYPPLNFKYYQEITYEYGIKF